MTWPRKKIATFKVRIDPFRLFLSVNMYLFHGLKKNKKFTFFFCKYIDKLISSSKLFMSLSAFLHEQNILSIVMLYWNGKAEIISKRICFFNLINIEHLWTENTNVTYAINKFTYTLE